LATKSIGIEQVSPAADPPPHSKLRVTRRYSNCSGGEKNLMLDYLAKGRRDMAEAPAYFLPIDGRRRKLTLETARLASCVSRLDES
jgi:hypothetical protein